MTKQNLNLNELNKTMRKILDYILTFLGIFLAILLSMHVCNYIAINFPLFHNFLENNFNLFAFFISSCVFLTLIVLNIINKD